MTRFVRAGVLYRLGRGDEALDEISDFSALQVDVLGPRHHAVLTTRQLRVDVLSSLARYDDALAELDAFMTTAIEILSPSHPQVSALRHSRAVVLSNLGRYGEALAELDTNDRIELEMKSLSRLLLLRSRSLRIGIEIATMKNVDRLGELREIIRELTSATSSASIPTLYSQYRLARLLYEKGLVEARNEIEAVINNFDPRTSKDHNLLRASKQLLCAVQGISADGHLVT
jgi:tetratricopeptide (TPR) repeat protein